jgi:hypothetical protein
VGRAAALGTRGFRPRPGVGVGTLQDARTGIWVITPSDSREGEEVEREAFTVELGMSSDLDPVAPETPVLEAFLTRQSEGFGRLLVLHSG